MVQPEVRSAFRMVRFFYISYLVNRCWLDLFRRVMTVKDQITELKKKEQILLGYLKAKIDDSDWHAVSDAANDIREIKTKIEVYEEMTKYAEEVSGESLRLAPSRDPLRQKDIEFGLDGIHRAIYGD